MVGAHDSISPRAHEHIFAFIGAEQGVFKNAFFTPVQKILGGANCLETTDIHQVVESSKRRCALGGKLLVILDEANAKTTKYFQSELKVTVTGTETTVYKQHQPPMHLDIESPVFSPVTNI